MTPSKKAKKQSQADALKEQFLKEGKSSEEADTLVADAMFNSLPIDQRLMIVMRTLRMNVEGMSSDIKVLAENGYTFDRALDVVHKLLIQFAIRLKIEPAEFQKMMVDAAAESEAEHQATLKKAQEAEAKMAEASHKHSEDAALHDLEDGHDHHEPTENSYPADATVFGG